MKGRSAIIEIEKRGDEYRIELRDRETGAPIDASVIDRAGTSKTPYKHVCKIRLPAESEPTIGFESDHGTDQVVLRAEGRTCYRHELPTPVTAN